MRFGHTFIVLDVDARVSLPGCLVDAVATAFLASLTKVGLARFAQVSKANPPWVSPHLGNDVLYPGHISIVPLLVSFVKMCDGCAA
jgi:hypothetical protein